MSKNIFAAAGALSGASTLPCRETVRVSVGAQACSVGQMMGNPQNSERPRLVSGLYLHLARMAETSAGTPVLSIPVTREESWSLAPNFLRPAFFIEEFMKNKFTAGADSVWKSSNHPGSDVFLIAAVRLIRYGARKPS